MRNLSYLAVCIVQLLCISTIARATCNYSYQIQTMLVNQHLMQVELYAPDAPGRHHLILMLHGTTGVFTRTSARPPARDNFGEKQLAAQCYVVALPHYFQAIGTQSLTNRAAIQDSGSFLLAAVRQVLGAERDRPDVLPNDVGIFGESLGGYLAIEIALSEPGITAVSVYGTGLLPTMPEASRAPCPQTILQHGVDDTIVPVADARKLLEALRQRKCPAALTLYPHEGHILSSSSEASVIDTTVEFFAHVFAGK